jgi:hypothetical protein
LLGCESPIPSGFGRVPRRVAEHRLLLHLLLHLLLSCHPSGKLIKRGRVPLVTACGLPQNGGRFDANFPNGVSVGSVCDCMIVGIGLQRFVRGFWQSGVLPTRKTLYSWPGRGVPSLRDLRRHPVASRHFCAGLSYTVVVRLDCSLARLLPAKFLNLIALGNHYYAGHADEQAVFDNSGHGFEGAGESGGIGDLAEVAV